MHNTDHPSSSASKSSTPAGDLAQISAHDGSNAHFNQATLASMVDNTRITYIEEYAKREIPVGEAVAREVAVFDTLEIVKEHMQRAKSGLPGLCVDHSQSSADSSLPMSPKSVSWDGPSVDQQANEAKWQVKKTAEGPQLGIPPKRTPCPHCAHQPAKAWTHKTWHSHRKHTCQLLQMHRTDCSSSSASKPINHPTDQSTNHSKNYLDVSAGDNSPLTPRTSATSVNDHGNLDKMVCLGIGRRHKRLRKFETSARVHAGRLSSSSTPEMSEAPRRRIRECLPAGQSVVYDLSTDKLETTETFSTTSSNELSRLLQPEPQVGLLKQGSTDLLPSVDNLMPLGEFTIKIT